MKQEIISAIILLLILLIAPSALAFPYGSQTFGTGQYGTGEFDSDNDGAIDSLDTDDDNDGVEDASDALTGSSNSVVSSTIIPNVTVANSVNLTQSFAGTQEVIIKDANITLVNFSFNFSDKTLNLANVTIERQNIDNKGATLVKGVHRLPPGQTKTMYVDRINTSLDVLCLKDAPIDRIAEISADCKAVNETEIACPGTSGSYACSMVEGNARYKVTGLSFSGAKQQPDNRGPNVVLHDPKPNSGVFHGNVTFVYKASDASAIQNCTLIINNKVNLTSYSIENNAFMNFVVNNVALRAYNWSVNCTDELGNIGDSNARGFSVFFMVGFNQSTFNISAQDIRNVTHFTVHKGGFGKINFTNSLDLSKGFDIDKHMRIAFNRIEVNASAIPDFNVSAQLEITDLTFDNPRILMDGVECPETVCKKISYSSGTLVFNISHWTAYSAEETPVEAAPSGAATGGGAAGGGGGGGGGGGTAPAVPVITEFTIDKTALKVVLKQGQTATETISIKNTGTTIFDVKALLEGIEQFKISPVEHEVTTTLQPNEEKTIEMTFKALADEKPDIYPAKIRLKSPSVEKEIDTVVEVDSAQPLFDVDVEVLPDSKSVFPGQEILMEVNLFNVRGFGRVDVNVEYSIKDFQGNTLATEHETLAVETQAKFTRSLLVPSDLKPGKYVALVKSIYADSIGTSSDLFEVKAKTIRLYPIQLKDYRVILLVGAVVLIIGALIFAAYKVGYLKKKAPKTEVEQVKQLKEEEQAEKLKKELEAVEQAYKSGFISEESYQKDKKRVEEKLSSLK